MQKTKEDISMNKPQQDMHETNMKKNIHENKTPRTS